MWLYNVYPHLPRTTLYNLGDEGWARIFYNLAKQVVVVFINIIIIFYNIVIIIFNNLAKQNQRERMFDVTGKHTFFFPVDSAFEVDIYIRRTLQWFNENRGQIPSALFELYRVHLQGNCTCITLEHWIEDGQADFGNKGNGFQACWGEGEEVDDVVGELPQAVRVPWREHRVWNVNVAFQQLEEQLEKIYTLFSFVSCQTLLSSVKVSRLSSFLLSMPSSLSLFKIPDSIKNFICCLSECEGAKLSRQWVVWRAVEGVELGSEEPGKSREDKVEHVLTHMDHDVVVQPKPVGNRVPVLDLRIITNRHHQYFLQYQV